MKINSVNFIFNLELYYFPEIPTKSKFTKALVLVLFLLKYIIIYIYIKSKYFAIPPYTSFTKYLSAYSYVRYFRKDIKIKVCTPEEIIILETSHIYTKALRIRKDSVKQLVRCLHNSH